MAAHAEARTHTTRHRRHQAAALLPDARCLVKLAILAPAHQLDGRFFTPVQTRIKQLARLPFTRGGTAMRDDEIEYISGPYFPVEIHVLAQRLEIGLNGARRCSRRSRRAVETVAHHTAYPQRRIVNAYNLAGK